MPGQVIPAAMRPAHLFDSYDFPLTVVGAAQGTKQKTSNLLNLGLTDHLARIRVHLSGTITVANPGGGADPGTATGKDNPEGFLISATLTTVPTKDMVPFNKVSCRALRVDGMVDKGWMDKKSAITDAAGSKTINQWYELDFARSPGLSKNGIEYSLPLPFVTQALLVLDWGGREQLFSGGTQVWDMRGLKVAIYSDEDVAPSIMGVHAHELAEDLIHVSASNSNFAIKDLPTGKAYDRIYILTEEAGALADGILNKIALTSGGRTWYPNESAEAVREMGFRRNRRLNVDPAVDLTGIYPLILDVGGSSTRNVDSRIDPIQLTLDVTAGANTDIRIVSRRKINWGWYRSQGK